MFVNLVEFFLHLNTSIATNLTTYTNGAAEDEY